MFRTAVLVVLSGLFMVSGCVSVDTGSTRVEVGPTHLIPSTEEDSPEATPYAKQVKRISRRHAKVSKELTRWDWENVIEESHKWVDETRELGGYADKSYDPRLFRARSQELLAGVESVYQAAARRDAEACQRSLNATGPMIDNFVRTFPLTTPEAMQAARAAGHRQSPAPTAGPARTPQAP